MYKVGIINHKGGVGKSTMTANLGAVLNQRGKRVLLIDMDPQSSLTIATGFQEPDSIDNNIAALLNNTLDNKPYDIRDYILKNDEGLLLIPSGQDLIRVELRLHQEIAREYVLKRALEQLEQYDFDYIFIDSPPFISLSTINIMSYIKGVLVPISPDFLSYKAFSILGESLANIKGKTNKDLEIIGLVFNFADLRTYHARDLIEYTKKTFGNDTYIFNTIIRMHTGIKEAQIKGQSITAYSPESIGSQDYNNFVNEFLEVTNGKK
jgi:chromosome partitioning protein